MRPIVLSSLGRPKSLMALLAVGSLALTFPTIAQEVQDIYPHTTVWVPESQGDHTQAQDQLFNWILWLTVIINILVFAVMGYFMVKYKSKPGQKTMFIHGNNKLEAVWTLIPTVIMALIAVFSHSTWAEMKYPQTDEQIDAQVAKGDAIKINIFAKQFMWYVQYPGPDGILGKIDPSQYLQNDDMIGLVRSGAGKDDVILNELVVPVDKTTHVRLQSMDVLHSFFLPTLRIKQDAVPGLSGKIWFRPNKLNVDMHGTIPAEKGGEPKLGHARPLDVICAELCGPQHYMMRASFYVVTNEQYLDYVNSQSPVNEAEDEEDDF